MGDLHDAERNEPMHVDDSPKLSGGHITKEGIKFVVSFFLCLQLVA